MTAHRDSYRWRDLKGADSQSVSKESAGEEIGLLKKDSKQSAARETVHKESDNAKKPLRREPIKASEES